MVKWVDADKIYPASYNPRKIKDDQFYALCQSIRHFGFVLPLIVNSANHTIIAGHQRLRAANRIGITKIPVIYVSNLCEADEIKFNQLHNSIDRNCCGTLACNISPGYHQTDCKNFEQVSSSATYLKEICKLLIKYGNVLSSVVADRKVVVGDDYIRACQLLQLPVNVYISDGDYDTVKSALTSKYGEYYYQHLERDTYVQGLAQLRRLGGGRRQRSALYEQYVIPWLSHHQSSRVLDFGAGKCEYQKLLSNRYEILPVEFYPNNGKSIFVWQANQMIDQLIDTVQKNGLFDAVVCDSVLNSVDSAEAELAVLRCCNLFLKDDGVLFISGRPLDKAIDKYHLRVDRNVDKRFLEFLDDDNFTANYRMGHWYYQHYHDKRQISELLQKTGFTVDQLNWCKFGDSFQVVCIKAQQIEPGQAASAINYEFDLPLPDNKSFGRNQEVLKLFGLNKQIGGD